MAKYKLMKHQRQGVKFLDSVDGIGALLFDPGTGKTGTTLAWIDRLAARTKEVRVLVVAPLAASDTWVLQPPMFMDSVVKARMLRGSTVQIMSKMAQAGNWADVPNEKIHSNHIGPRSDARVTILSLSAGAISSYCTERTKTVRMLRAIRKYDPHVIVMDESHIIKSATANISKAMYQIGQLAPHRIILTGTVTPHSALDVYGQWRFLAPWTFSDVYGQKFTQDPLKMTKAQTASVRPWAWGRFKDRYTIPGGYKGKGIGGFQNLGDLNDRIAERSMVVRKEDALDLPPVTDVDVHVTLSPRENRAYTEMAEELAAELEDGTLLEAPNPLSKIMKLRQIASGFVRDTETGEVHIIGSSMRKSVVDLVNTTLAGENRLVVFAYFRYECDLLAQTLAKDKNATVELITGQTKDSERLAIRQRFGDVSRNPERTILVAQQRTLSLSVNELVTAQHAIYASISERRDDWKQSRDRLDRKGQTKPVTFWNCFTPGLIGEVMIERHKERGDLETALLNHIKEFSKKR